MTGMLSKISVTATPEASGKKNFRLIPLEDNWLGQWTRLDGSGSGRQAGRQASGARSLGGWKPKGRDSEHGVGWFATAGQEGRGK